MSQLGSETSSQFNVGVLRWGAASLLLISGCAGEALWGEVAGIQSNLQRAIAGGSKANTCAPKETAMAEANIKFAEDALTMGEYSRGRNHVKQAHSYTDLALKKTDPETCLGPVLETSSGGDRDGDGIDDQTDQCPDDPEDADGFQDLDGCSDPDNDADGILDAQQFIDGQWINADKNGEQDCRNSPEDKDGFEDEDGCPDPDNDVDGILDTADKCPNEPEDSDGFEDEDGCPDLDNDRDGILDLDDACPNEPEDLDGDADEDGCPDLQAKLDGCSIRLQDKVYFRVDKWEVDQKSYSLLNDVATILKTYPEIRVEIGGHTDSKGSDKYNQKLSQRRVESVQVYLLSQQVSATRLTAVGYGETMPVDTNRNSSGRSNNRRVEFNRTDGACKNQ